MPFLEDAINERGQNLAMYEIDRRRPVNRQDVGLRVGQVPEDLPDGLEVRHFFKGVGLLFPATLDPVEPERRRHVDNDRTSGTGNKANISAVRPLTDPPLAP